ncbi:hypothetical protein PybrP1_002079 [[Pythium] brassicae (nom. inval.)]|nr:hypothetical protein PybrP1_002079 [[Pythium] brassicae (nom. inval.)]
MRITVALTVTAAGAKLPPLLIWKGSDESIKRLAGAYVAQQGRACVNSNLLQKWIDIAFPAVLDSAVKSKCTRKNIDMIVIPGGLTPYLQAGNISIYKSSKDRLSTTIDKWKRSGQA